MDKIYVVLLNLRSHPMHSARCPTRDIVISWIHIAWTNLEVSQLRQCRVSAPQLGESIQEGLPLFHGIKWAEIQPIFPPLICWPATFIQCAVCTGFIRLDWECISHYFSWLQSQVSSEFAADWNLVNGCDWCRRLPYSTDSYFHILIFVFVSWVGGGDPPWVPAKSLSLHGGQKILARTAFFSKLVLCVYLKGVNAKKMAEKGEKHIEKRHFLTVQ